MNSWKLIKTGNDYLLRDSKGETLAISGGNTKGRMLSLKNCQAIERGYDLDELINESFDNMGYHSTVTPHEEKQFKLGYTLGFQKAVEILGDKKFSEEDVRKAYIQGTNDGAQFESMRDYDSEDDNEPWEFAEEAEKELIQSLQQNEWDVEIEMEDHWLKSKTDACPNFHIKYGCSDISKCVCRLPKLDADGCLILKRINNEK
jgi:hypothetical protein